MLARRSGAIVGISSLAARRALPGTAAYGASKAALSSMLEALRLEAAGSGVQISIVECGFVRTEATARNKTPLPFIVDVALAARSIAAGAAAGEGWIRFPWQTTVAMSLVRALPAALYEGASAVLQRRKNARRARKSSAPSS
jgi:short-subunit dehydrogenase